MYNRILFNKYASESMVIPGIEETCAFLDRFKKCIFITTSNRVVHNDVDTEMPKSSQIAHVISHKLKRCEASIIDASKLKIYICEGNISKAEGNNCGVKESSLKDKDKNPDGNLRCWCSFNHKDDELWKIHKPMMDSDAIVFFTSIRWGQTNSVYQKLLERLSWIENRHTSLKEENIVSEKYAGVISCGHNFNGKEAIELQKKNMKYFGFKIDDRLFWSYQYTNDSKDERLEGYIDDANKFEKLVQISVKKTD